MDDKNPVAHVSFSFEPHGDVFNYGGPVHREIKARLKIVLWRRNAEGVLEISETYPLADAHSLHDFDLMINRAHEDLERSRTSVRHWFGGRPPPWRWPPEAP